MVKNISNLTNSGLGDWLLQRLSAVILAVYIIFILRFLLTNPSLNYETWHALFNTTWMKIFSTISLTALITHSWIGIWTVITDYFSSNLGGTKVTCLRISLQLFSSLVLFVFLIWGLMIFWGGQSA